MEFTNKQKQLMKSNAIASVKKRKLQNLTAKPEPNQSVYFFCQLQYTGYDNAWLRTRDRNREKRRRKKRERGREREKKEERAIYPQTACVTTFLKIFENMCQLLWSWFPIPEFLTTIRVVFEK